MKAITVNGPNQISLQEVPRPEAPDNGYVIIRMEAMGINPGDKFLISGAAPKGFFPTSQYDIAGVSGVGKVIAIGAGVPQSYQDKYVTVYRSLQFSDRLVGTWSEYAHLPFLQCVVLPDDVAPEEYSAALVNIITSYAAWRQAIKEGHKAVIITAGNSATGLAMLGICQQAGFPVISIVRNGQGKKELEALGAEHLVIHGSQNFKQQLSNLATSLKATAVFDGVGGALLTDMMDSLLPGSTVYAYGFLGAQVPVSFHTSVLTKGITLKGFNNFKTDTVQDPSQLQKALTEIGKIISMPHFKTRVAQTFPLEKAAEALAFVTPDGGKVVLRVG